MSENGWSLPPASVPFEVEREEHWRRLDNSVNAVSFGFVATAILISMFLVMAIFERFLRPRSHQGPDFSLSNDHYSRDPEAQHVKLETSSPSMSVYCKGVSVLMPGQVIPTFIAHPAPPPPPPPPPPPCPPERIPWPPHHHSPISTFHENIIPHT
ncbi:hypothetical protein AMTRI_Chr02g219130 [Amborella trichopoda]|uniref:Uncharacterized protein n=1 Tax=Amborella trichopoda TaxID=13333 RepID=W1P0P6_AMBTC|nr:formin-like protein 16 [Amborella trichopoda]XP_020521045.1 formin-like protein 16 [Amborella trichopoda]ERN03412.1 hypothetical protein AMTR_s00003p00259750 [Amborella trichopoda]|eukprot:XP_006841737.1 formin-like protein 16 [Amborella trichopoda]